MDLYDRVVETLILVVVSAETYLTWQYMAHNHKQRIRRKVNKLLKSVGVHV